MTRKDVLVILVKLFTLVTFYAFLVFPTQIYCLCYTFHWPMALAFTLISNPNQAQYLSINALLPMNVFGIISDSSSWFRQTTQISREGKECYS